MEDNLDFLTLQGLIKKNPEGYTDEIQMQMARFEALNETIMINDDENSAEIIELPDFFPRLLSFVVNISSNLPKTENRVGIMLKALIEKSGLLKRLKSGISLAVIKSVTFLHNRDFYASEEILPCLFDLFSLPDKQTRNIIFFHIVGSLSRTKRHKKNIRRKKREVSEEITNNKLRNNRSASNKLVAFFEKQTASDDIVKAKKSISILCELYRRGPFRNAKVANIIAENVFSKHSSAKRQSAWFLLGEKKSFEDEDLDTSQGLENSRHEETRIERGMRGAKRITKAQRKLDRVKKKIKKIEKVISDKHNTVVTDFSPIRSIIDPHKFAERLFKSLRASRENFETKLLLMRLTSRVIAAHELVLVNYYSFLQRYMQPHQRNVTKVLAYLVQACHAMVPTQALQGCIRSLAYNFISDRSSPQIIAAGINTIREIAARQPLAVEEDLLRDLSQYKTANEKCISVAARGLISLFREVNPLMLSKKDRGRPQKFNEKEREINENDFEINGKEREINENDFEINGKEREINENDFEINEKEREINEKKVKFNENDFEINNCTTIKKIEKIKVEKLVNVETEIKNLINFVPPRKTKKDETQLDSESEQEITPEFPVTENDILGNVHKRKKEISERIDKKKERFQRRKKGGGTTNEDKNRKKNFKLTKHSFKVRSRGKRSLSAKNRVEGEHNKRMKLKSRRKFKRKR